jgi:hypothetical protein
MAQFPQLKTGAVMQYPAERHERFATEVARFVDGSEQRHREMGSRLRRWVVKLELLDEGELALIERFFESVEGAAGTFTFVDPRDGASYPNCSFENESIALEIGGPHHGGTTMVVRENRI